MLETLSFILQAIVGLGLLNVWLLRAGQETGYRGGGSDSLRGEFQAYGLPSAVFYGVGFLKITGGIALIAGIWIPTLVVPAASVIAALMVGALAMHLRVGDPPKKSVPALLMLGMSAAVAALNLA